MTTVVNKAGNSDDWDALYKSGEMYFKGEQIEWIADGVNIRDAEPKRGHPMTKPSKKSNVKNMLPKGRQ